MRERETFADRLENCAHKAGGMKALAMRSGVSRAQLSRYIKGASTPTITKVNAIAAAVGVRPGWLFSGERRQHKFSSQVVLDRDIFLHVLEKIERVLLNRGYVMPPYRKALFVFAMSKAAEQSHQQDRSFLLSEQSLFEMLDFMRPFAQDEDIQTLFKAIEFMSLEKDPATIMKWEAMLCQAHIAVYDTLSGQQYFERMGPVHGARAQAAQQLIHKVAALKTSLTDILDLGCGNGRYLAFFHRCNPDWQLTGVDTSQIARQRCEALAAEGVIPKQIVHPFDMRYLPFLPESFDFVFARNSLFCAPLTPNGKGGLDAVFAGIFRILRPGGVFHGMVPYGSGQLSFYYGQQTLNEEMLHTLCQRHGFLFMGQRCLDVNQSLFKDTPHEKMHEGYKTFLTFEVVKPARPKL